MLPDERNSQRPQDWVPALPRAQTACFSVRLSSSAAAMAEPKGPQVPVLCQTL
jgi:hypothetical protein